MMQINKTLLYLFFLLAAIGVYFLTHNTTLCYDDFGYKLILSPEGFSNQRVAGFSDLIYSQYNHYFIHNGRVFIHFIVQLFLIPDNKIWFDISNAIVFFIFQIFFFKLAYRSLSSVPIFSYLVFLIFFWFLMPATNYCLLWLSCSINYLWAITAVFGFLLLFRRVSEGWKPHVFLQVMLVFYSFICGGSQELITIPVSISLMLYFLFRYSHFSKQIASIVIPFWIGTLFISLAPGNSLRIIRQNVDYLSFKKIIESVGGFLFSYGELKVFYVLILLIILLIFFKRELFIKVLRHNFIIVSSILFSILFLLYLGYYRPRFFYPISVLSLLLLFISIDYFSYLFKYWYIKMGLMIPLIFVIVQYVSAVNELHKYKNEFCILEKKIITSEDCVFQAPSGAKTRFFCGGLGKIDRHFWINTSMSSLYHKRELVFLPKELYSFINNSIENQSIDSCDIEIGIKNSFFKEKIFIFRKSNYMVIPMAEMLYSETKNLHLEYRSHKVNQIDDLQHWVKRNIFGTDKSSRTIEEPCYCIKTSKGIFLYFSKISDIEEGIIKKLNLVEEIPKYYNFKGVPY